MGACPVSPQSPELNLGIELDNQGSIMLLCFRPRLWALGTLMEVAAVILGVQSSTWLPGMAQASQRS